MKFRSLESWNKNGKRVKKGEKCSARTIEGVPLFSNKQVENMQGWYEEKDHSDGYGGQDWDYDDLTGWDNFGDWGFK